MGRTQAHGMKWLLWSLLLIPFLFLLSDTLRWASVQLNEPEMQKKGASSNCMGNMHAIASFPASYTLLYCKASGILELQLAACLTYCDLLACTGQG